MDIDGPAFKQLATECAWVISASFSEGGGGSILNCMAKGLIPIISRSSSITLPEKTGLYLENNDPAGIIQVLNNLDYLNDNDLEEMSLNAHAFIVTNHTLKNFKDRYKELLLMEQS